jgi:hypothetical protein
VAVTVGKLAVELDARTQEFRSAMRGAEGRIDQFERKAGQGTERAGSAFRGLVGPIAAVAGALVALGGIRFGMQIAKGAIQSAAAFESYEIRLKGLLGSQEAANKSLESFVTLSTRTPFAVAQIVEGATTLASVADGSRKELDALTKTTANLAAVTGLSFNEAAGNLQRALAAGIGAADLFRDRGVRKLIEDIQGIPNLTKVPLDELRQLFKDTFGPDAMTPFATAAEELSQTMGGALSNIGDAAANAKRELGEALSPAVFGAAKAVVIPFFQDLEALVVANEDAITAFATEGVRKLLLGFKATLDSGADVLDLFDEMGAELGDFPAIFGAVSEAFGIFFDAVKTGLKTILLLLTKMGLGWSELGNKIGWVSDEEFEAIRLAEKLFTSDLATMATEFAEGLPERFDEIGRQLLSITEDSESFADGLRHAGIEAGLAADEVGKLVDQFVRARREREAARDESAGAGAGGYVPAPELEALAGFGGGIEFDIAQETALRKKRAAATKEAEEDAAKASERLAADMAWNLTSALGEGFYLLLNEEGLSFAEGLARMSGDLLEDSIGSALDLLEEGLASALEGLGGEGGLLSGLLGGLGGEGGLDMGKISAGIGAVAGIAGGLISNAIAGTQATIRGGQFTSAVTSTQAVRGIVAGDVSVPIAEVAGALRDMNVQTVAEQRRTNTLLTEIRDRLGGLGGDTGSAAEMLAAAVTDELGGSVALG